MRDDLRRRLRELGVVRGVRELAERAPARRAAVEDVMEGRFHTTSHGQCFVIEETYPPGHRHGDLPLASFLTLSPDVLAQVARDEVLAEVDLRRVCFLDTETTGLSAGTGTMAFVVGLGFFTDEGFHLRQYFLRDPGDEPAMVEALAEILPTFEALASFNGRAFDVPILENRFVLARVASPTAGLAHLDLLPPARRLWRHHLPSCALGTLERRALGVRREQADVPGGVIPTLYRDYLRTGDAREMKRVIYHNAVDILSLVTLAARLCRAFADPWGEEELGGAEFYALGRWYAADDRLPSSRRAYRASLAEADSTRELRARALRDLAYLLKRGDRRGEAFAYWQQLALEQEDDVLPCVELAKHFEWHIGNLPLAAAWTRVALDRAAGWPAGPRRQRALGGLRHRLERLERKLAARVE